MRFHRARQLYGPIDLRIDSSLIRRALRELQRRALATICPDPLTTVTGASYARLQVALPIAAASNRMKVVRGKTFNGQRIVLDGKSFVECHFKDSNLIIEGNGLFEMQNCKIEEDCRLAVEGPGQVLLHALKMMLYSGGWMSRVADNVLHAVKQPPKAMAKKKAAP